MSRRPGRRRRSQPATIIDFSARPGQNPLYTSRWAAAVTDAEKAKGRKLTKTEMRELEDVIRAGIEYHAVPDPADEQSVTDVIGPVPEMDWPQVPVPAAQAEEQARAQRAASGPQPAFYAPAPGSHPYPSGPQPTFTPHGAGHGSRDTQAYTPDFAEAGSRPRPYTPYPAREVLMPLPEDAEILDPAMGDWLAQRWQPAEAERQSWKARQQTGSINYPKCGMRASFGDYAGVLGKASEITGTHGTSRWPLQALPAADPRWAALAAEALDYARWFEDDNPEQAAAYRRLHEYVTAAPDCETAVRLAELAAEAKVISRKLPAAMREQKQARDAA